MSPTPERTITPPFLDLEDRPPCKKAVGNAALLEGLGPSSSNKMTGPIMKHSVSMLEMNEIDDMKNFFGASETERSLGDECHGGLLGVRSSAAPAAAGAEDYDDFLFFDAEDGVDDNLYKLVASAASSSSAAADNITKIGSSNDSGGMRRVQSMGAMAGGSSKNFSLLTSMVPDIDTIPEDDIEVDDDNIANTREEQLVQVNFGDDDAKFQSSNMRRRQNSSNSLLSSNSSQHSQPKKSSMKKSTSTDTLKRNVSFTNLEIRSYNITAGDAPTPNGVPLSLDWEYDPEATQTIDVDTYETHRGARRLKHEMYVPNLYRVYLLMRDAGLSRRQIKMSIDESQRAFKNRQKTAKNLKMQPVEEALEMTKRKLSKLTRKIIR